MNIFKYKFDWENLNLFDVLNGCSEAVLNIIKGSENPSATQEIANYRMGICRQCPLGEVDGITCFRSDDYTVPHMQTGESTMGCGCFLACKTPLKNTSCPVGKWNVVLD